MSSADPPVYVCYRHSVSLYLALELYHALRADEVGLDVFMDAQSETRDAHHFRQIEACSHFLVVLAPGLIEAFQKPDDPMLAEIEFAAHKRRGIVPLLAYDFSFRGAPDEIDFLRRYYALPLAAEMLTETVAQLRDQLLPLRIFGEIVPLPPDQAAQSSRVPPIPTEQQLYLEALFNHALARNRQDHAGKIADLDQVLRLNPDHVYARFYRALARRRSGDDLGALDDYDEAIRSDPQFHKAYNNRAEIFFALGDYEQALTDYDQATALCDHYVMALAGKALTLHALDRVEQALDLWKPLLAEDQRFCDAAWVGRELHLPSPMIEEAHRLTLHLSLPDASDSTKNPPQATGL